MMVYLLFACLVAKTIALKPVPLFIVDAENATSHIKMPPPNPFIRLPTQSFSEIVKQIVALDGTIVVFIENKFCVEYVTTKDESGITPYSYLHDALLQGKVTYIPAAVDPYTTLNELIPVTPHNEFHLSYDGTSNKELFTRNVQKSNYYYIYFKDRVNTTVTRRLREHDLLMYEVFFSMRNVGAPPLVAFYTGMMNPITYKSRRPVARYSKSNKNAGGPRIFFGTRSLFVFFGVYNKGSSIDAQEHRVDAETSGVNGEVKVSLNFALDFHVRFVFYSTEKMWKLDHIELINTYEYKDTVIGFTRVGVQAPWNYSYICGSAPLRIRNTEDDGLYILSKYQIQLFPETDVMKTTTTTEAMTTEGDTEGAATETEAGPPETDDKRQKFLRDGSEPEESLPSTTTPVTTSPPKKYSISKPKASLRFGPTLNCNKFLSIPIIEGLCVGFIFLGGILIGANLLCNIKPNTRFDDPRGPHLSFAED